MTERKLDLKVLRQIVEDAKGKGWYSTPLSPSTILALLDRLEAAESALSKVVKIAHNVLEVPND